MKLLLQTLFTFTISINIYSQYGLPYYERFYNDTIEAKLFKKNRIKSISDFRQNLIYNKPGKGTWWEKREYNVEGFLSKKTNLEIIVYSGRISDDFRLDSITYSYDSINKQIIETDHIRKYPECTIFSFDSNGRIVLVESNSNGQVKNNEIFIYNLEDNTIIEIDTNKYHRINGNIYKVLDNKIIQVYNYYGKDTTLYKSIEYSKNEITVYKYLPKNNKQKSTRYFDSEGRILKEFRESENYLIAEEYTYGNNYVKEISYRRDIESNFSIFYPVFFSITYLKENGLPDYRIDRSQYHSYTFIRYFYEYYE